MVNYKSLIEGSNIYHDSKVGISYNLTYDRFLEFRAPSIHNTNEPIGIAEAESLKSFANSWKGHCQMDSQNIKDAISSKWHSILTLRNHNILSSDLATIQNLIHEIFNTIAGSGKRYESTNTSKFLHLLQPDLFVMWDNSIREGYDVERNGRAYAYSFLPYMQEISRKAVDHIIKLNKCSTENAVETICACGHKLTKVLDEYNFVRFTMNY